MRSVKSIMQYVSKRFPKSTLKFDNDGFTFNSTTYVGDELEEVFKEIQSTLNQDSDVKSFETVAVIGMKGVPTDYFWFGNFKFYKT